MYFDQQMEWVKTLKVGDEVAMVSYDHCRSTRYGVVVRLTPTQIVVKRQGDELEIRFYKRNPSIINGNAKGLEEQALYPVEASRIIRLRKRIENQNWWKVPTAVLEQVDGILEDYRETPGENPTNT